MPLVKALFTDYNGTLEPKYLEILLGYALKDYHKSKGNIENYQNLRRRQFRLWKTFLDEGSDAVLSQFVDTVLVGEDRETFDAAMETVCSGRTDYISAWIRLAGKLSSKIGKKLCGEIDPDAVEVFKEAKK